MVEEVLSGVLAGNHNARLVEKLLRKQKRIEENKKED